MKQFVFVGAAFFTLLSSIQLTAQFAAPGVIETGTEMRKGKRLAKSKLRPLPFLSTSKGTK